MSKTLITTLVLILLLTSCTVYIPQSSPYVDLLKPEEEIAEALLLDIGIGQFDEGATLLSDEDNAFSLMEVRKAESRYVPVILQQTLIQTASWGEVYVLPTNDTRYDLAMKGRIVESSAHTLGLEIEVHDASGKLWYKKIYTEYVGDNAYGTNSIGVNDPFQGLYNRIANDLLSYRKTQLSAENISEIRQLSQMQFGQAFSPELYTQYVTTDAGGIRTVLRLPPAEEPVNIRIEEIRLRDREFHTVLQQHYFNYTQLVSESYFQYRRSSFLELQDLQEQQAIARNQMIGGVLLIGVAVAASDSDSVLDTSTAVTAASVGVDQLSKGMRSYQSESQFMQEIVDSFAGDVSSEVVELDGDLLTLTGSVEELYQQWEEILHEMFVADRDLQRVSQ